MNVLFNRLTVKIYFSLPPLTHHPRIETPTKGSSSGSTNRMSPTLNQDSGFGDRQFMVITSEKQCRIVALPSQNCVHRLQITETDFVVRAEVISMKGKHTQRGMWR